MHTAAPLLQLSVLLPVHISIGTIICSSSSAYEHLKLGTTGYGLVLTKYFFKKSVSIRNMVLVLLITKEHHLT